MRVWQHSVNVLDVVIKKKGLAFGPVRIADVSIVKNAILKVDTVPIATVIVSGVSVGSRNRHISNPPALIGKGGFFYNNLQTVKDL